jgi:hypothetical protein
MESACESGSVFNPLEALEWHCDIRWGINRVWGFGDGFRETLGALYRRYCGSCDALVSVDEPALSSKGVCVRGLKSGGFRYCGGRWIERVAGVDVSTKMSDDIEERPVWDEAIAESVVGKVVLVGLTYLEADGEVIERQQFFGTVVTAHCRNGILLSLKGQRAGEQYNLPPDTRAIEIASRGKYRLRGTGEVVTDPDYTAMFSIAKQAE